MQLLAVAGIVTVLVSRTYLALTGYPQLGGGTLHIAHLLWGGLLMLAGLVSALLFVGRGARALTALLGGVGLSLVVDEVGKFVTRDNDYFYRPGAAIIYMVFVVLLVFGSVVDRRRPLDPDARLANAAQIASDGLVSGLTHEQRQTAHALPAGHEDEAARAARALLDAASARQRRVVLERISRLALRAARFAERSWLTELVLTLFVLSRVPVAIVFVVQALAVAAGPGLAPGADSGAVVASAVTRAVTALVALIGAARWRSDRRDAYRWIRAAVVLELVVTEIFAFDDSQFAAILELPFDLLVWGLTSRRLRAGREASMLPWAGRIRSSGDSTRERLEELSHLNTKLVGRPANRTAIRTRGRR